MADFEAADGRDRRRRHCAPQQPRFTLAVLALLLALAGTVLAGPAPAAPELAAPGAQDRAGAFFSPAPACPRGVTDGKRQTATHDWDPRDRPGLNQLASLTEPGDASSTTFAYSPAGQRTRIRYPAASRSTPTTTPPAAGWSGSPTLAVAEA